MNARVAVALFLLGPGLGCGKASDITAIEDLGDADLKVVIARSDRRSDITVLAADAPFIYRQEPLAEIFARKASLQVIVIGLRSQDLRALYPYLPDRPPAELAQRLDAKLGPIQAGLYRPSTPTRVLSTRVEEQSSAELEYTSTDLASLGDDAAFGLALPGDLVCPPIDRPLRVFPEGNPGLTCVYTRDARCAWQRQGPCPNEATIFGEAFPSDQRIFQLPDGTVVLPNNTQCAPMDRSTAILGQTRAWRCGTRSIGVLETPASTEALERIPVQGAELRSATLFAPGSAGVYAVVGAKSLRRLKVLDKKYDLETLLLLMVDRPDSGESLSLVDSTHAELLAGNFGSDVASGMCLAIGGDYSRIEQVAANALTLHHPLPAMAPSTGWYVFGQPRESTNYSPPIALPDRIGTLLRLSATGDNRLVVQGSGGGYDASAITFFGNRNHYQCPFPVATPPNFDGELVASESGYYALTASGLAILDADGAVNRTISLGGPAPANARIFRLAANSANERLVIAAVRGSEVIVISTNETATRRSFDGEVLSFVSSPLRVIYQPNNAIAELRAAELDPGSTAERRYLVPPFDESPNAADAAIRLGPDATNNASGRQQVVYGQNRHVGVLDLNTGMSTAFRLGDEASSRVVFRGDTGDSYWALVASSTNAAVLRLP